MVKQLSAMMRKALSVSSTLVVTYGLSFSALALVNDQTELPVISNTISMNTQLIASGLVEQQQLEGETNTLSFSEPGASFIKVHFSQVSLPDGAVLEISDPERDEVYQYSRTHNTPRTWDSNRGDDGIHQFYAMSIEGDAVEIRLVASNVKEQASVTVDYLQVGLPVEQVEQVINLGPAGEESICGSDNKQPAACYANSYSNEYQHSKPVARLLIGGRSLCTAWRVGPDNTMMTNNHCIESAAEAANTEVWFNYQLASCNGAKASTVKVQANQLLETGTTLDYTLFNVNNFAAIQSFGYLGLDPRIPSQSETIYIPQHPGGRLKELGVVMDTSGTRCQVDQPVIDGRGAGTDAGYLCDTEGGSSGSPVVALRSNKVIALHHLGGCYNKGAHISKIWPKIASHFPAGIPDSQVNSGGTQQAPFAKADIQCEQRQCRFDASQSLDSDGSIVTYSWKFGDGSTASSPTTSHSYAIDGQYAVTLTVIDNSGLSDAVTQTIAVQANTGGGSCSNLQVWSSSEVYLGGDRVQYAGHQYEAKWWTKGDDPETHSSQWSVWKKIDACI
ncbi:PKD domain-containing protein [Vibrio sp. ZSDZ65]|uniref:PKD domain-containing protein n=1 Tax=Vibrio qingdaonensis TaxID=2829491 RepID=A0A9X3HWX4_9VIBR|nr:PKD domain-containing protein [Vibrio qingdaonensis]MCW8346729.1 PKD domain-containing protein [Vibrio qingdaonensis]